MMKKKYMEPLMEVEIMEMNQQLLAGSVIGDDVFDEDAGDGLPGMAPGFTSPEELINPANMLGIPGF